MSHMHKIIPRTLRALGVLSQMQGFILPIYSSHPYQLKHKFVTVQILLLSAF